jgi:two-component sensor histidine kinase
MIFFRLFFILLLAVSVQAQTTNDGQECGNLLEHSQIYIDNSNSLEIEDILKGKVEFKNNNKKLLAYGYSPDFSVWIKFSLTNETDEPLYKVIEYDNTLTTNVEFYNPNRDYVVEKEGLFNVKIDRKTLNPVFEIKVNPQETQTYYMRVSSHITTLIVKLNIWDNKTFYEKEIRHQVVLALFFGAMMILAIYNIFIFFITRDISYLFYFLYVVGVSAHHVVYVGIGNIYILNQTWILYIIIFASLLTSFPIFVLALFTKTFLQTKQYARLDKILNAFIVILPISVFLFTITDEYNKFRNILPIILMIYLLGITIYAAFRKNKQAYFILFGWLAICLAIIFMLLSSTGVFNIFEHVYYYIEGSLLFEATIFSIALAYRIKQLQDEKVRVSKKLVVQQENETKRLAIQVEEKTAHLGIALEEKQLLLKELHHRVKNNMQMIVSLIRLQKDKVKDNKLQDLLVTIQNRISAMSHLHELLFKQENATHIDTYEYFDLMIDGIRDSYHHDLKIELNIKAKLKMEEAIYCGLILNELITNSFKYAFAEKNGTIEVSLKKENSYYILSVSDDGIGYDTAKRSSSLGLTLVNALAKKQLKGDIKISSSNGVKTIVSWKDSD